MTLCSFGLRLLGRRPLLACSFAISESRRFALQSSTGGENLCREAAQSLFSMERFHRNSHVEGERRQVERQAWRELQKLPDSATENADINDITDVLGAWCYFSRFWEQGMRGPGEEEQGKSDESREKEIKVPSVERSGARFGAPTADEAPPPRANPLDEVLEF
ncbi:uncharacterized protein TM35_000072930 [Trypanosoma theileri]|uniref:RNA-editing substrate-binding complex 7 protein domain-containing protein n=1 Tax=Trypanosoma theileri TaxID=67003 RepID=A0A1X0P2U0_9TRYP|nr:uncharacterized protein TM35_000072930 [Trypanosoma theileri]ORC90869.1 hypothetical protein TM35_000072930 [Trypanosoma theileri]